MRAPGLWLGSTRLGHHRDQVLFLGPRPFDPVSVACAFCSSGTPSALQHCCWLLLPASCAQRPPSFSDLLLNGSSLVKMRFSQMCEQSEVAEIQISLCSLRPDRCRCRVCCEVDTAPLWHHLDFPASLFLHLLSDIIHTSIRGIISRQKNS